MMRHARSTAVIFSAALGTLAAAATLASAQPQTIANPAVASLLGPKSVVFKSPKGEYVTTQDKYHTFRIPGMVVAADGTLLAFAEGRRGNGGDPRIDKNSPIDLVMRRSTDNGATWGPLVVIDSGFQPNGDKVDFGDPTPVLDRTSGAIFVLYGQWPDIGSKTVSVGQHKVWVRTSRDNGLKWSDRTQVKYSTAPKETSDKTYWHQAEPGPGNGIQLKWQDSEPSRNGRLVIPAKRSGSETPTGSVTVRPFAYYSDDHGATWHVGHVTAGPDANEDEVVELANGKLLLDARQDDGQFRRRHVSTDGGQTWDANVPDDLVITMVDASMNRFSSVRDGHDRDRILFSAPRGNGKLVRSNLTIWTSYDEGQSFINPVQLTNEGAAYSVVQRLPDGTIGVLVETSDRNKKGYRDISFFNVGIEHLEGAKYPKTLTHYDGFENAIDLLRGGIGWSGGWRTSGAAIETGNFQFAGYLPSRDNHHAFLRGASISRDLGTALDLEANHNCWFSLFVRPENQDAAADPSGSLKIALQDSEGAALAAFGVGSKLTPFARIDRETAHHSRQTLDSGATHLFLAKLVARNDTQPGNRDELLVTWYTDQEELPRDESQIKWKITGKGSKNGNGVAKSLQIAATGNVGWRVDEIRLGKTFDSVVAKTRNDTAP